MSGADKRDLEWKLSHLDWWRELVLPALTEGVPPWMTGSGGVPGPSELKVLERQPAEVQETVTALMRAAEISGKPLGSLFPGLSELDGRPSSVVASVRAQNIVGRFTGDNWHELAGYSVSQMISWANSGRVSSTDILVAVVTAWCRNFDPLPVRTGHHADAEPPEPTVHPSADANEVIVERVVESAHLELLQRAARDGYRAGAQTLGEAIGLSVDGGVDSAALRELSRLKLDELVPVDASLAWTQLLDFDERGMHILAGRIYPVGDKKTLDALARELDVTRERVRQVEKNITVRLRDRLAFEVACAPVAHMAARLARQCGALCSDAVMAAAINEFLGAEGSDREVRTAVLRGLAGPYEFKDSFWQRADGSATIRRRLLERADRPVESDELQALMDEFDVHPEARDAVITSMPLREFDGHLLVWTGSMTDKAIAILRLRGEPMSRDDLRQALGGDEVNFRSMSNAIQSDERIRRLGRDKYGLAEWGGEEYTTIVDEITQAIERRGGRADLDEVIEELVDWFDVSAASVRTYATTSGVFSRDEEGFLVVVPDGVEVERAPQVPPETSRDLFLHDGVWAARILVDSEVLRGSGRPCRNAVAHAAGVWPGDALTIDTPQGQTNVSWKRHQPTYGSTRAIAVALGCEDGDLMFVPLTGRKDCWRVAARDLAEASGLSRVALECGLDADATIADVAVAIGLDADAAATDVAVRLRSRQQGEIAREIPTGPDTDDDVLSELMGLGE